MFIETGARLLDERFMAMLESLQIGVFALAFEDEGGFVRPFGPTRGAGLFREPHAPFHRGEFAFGVAYGIVERSFRGSTLLAPLELLHAAVYEGYGGLLATEKVVGAQHVVNRRHEVVVSVDAAEISRECGQKAQTSVGVAHREHSEHLAAAQLVAPLVARGDVTPHLFGGHSAQRVGRIGEGPRE